MTKCGCGCGFECRCECGFGHCTIAAASGSRPVTLLSCQVGGVVTECGCGCGFECRVNVVLATAQLQLLLDHGLSLSWAARWVGW